MDEDKTLLPLDEAVRAHWQAVPEAGIITGWVVTYVVTDYMGREGTDYVEHVLGPGTNVATAVGLLDVSRHQILHDSAFTDEEDD